MVPLPLHPQKYIALEAANRGDRYEVVMADARKLYAFWSSQDKRLREGFTPLSSSLEESVRHLHPALGYPNENRAHGVYR